MWTDLEQTKQVNISNIKFEKPIYVFVLYKYGNYLFRYLNYLISEPGVHHIPLNIHGFPDIPNFNMNEEAPLRRKVKKSTKNKPLYKPPPVLTKYVAPESSERLSQEYRHQYPDASSTNSKVAETSVERDSLMGLSSFMENLMGKHSAWIKRAWQGRDEAAAAA